MPCVRAAAVRAAARRVASKAGTWIGVGVVVGVLSGLSSAAFLGALAWATRTRVSHGFLLYLLPVAGFGIGALYLYAGGRSGTGSALVLEEIHEPVEHLPRRMAPYAFAVTAVCHIFGASVGREGVAIQMSAGLSDTLARAIGWTPDRRRFLLEVAIAGGFGSVFGAPVAGAVFALEVPTARRLRVDPFVPCLVAAFVGDAVTRGVGVHHDRWPIFTAGAFRVSDGLRTAVLGVAFGCAALLFVQGLKLVESVAKRVTFGPLRTAAGGAVIVALAAIVGTRQYLGLSSPLALRAVAGLRAGFGQWFGKLAFTVISLGTGFFGGEVTPLFVIGTTLGSAIGPWVGVPAGVAAMAGFTAVFAAASNAPIACTILAVELFGGRVLPYAAVACAVAVAVSGDHSIYHAQRRPGAVSSE